ncbi:TlpA family protein disulfide reductase [Catellatospora methionotrophica]|uniref:TlpA family protein disulfide reductase n=1 Tax=Catellatospora methionotrophica TaxID=121620 RepID=UPI0033D3AB97
MLASLWGVVAVLAVATVLNLLLCLAVIRKLRAAPDGVAEDPHLPVAGTAVGDFTVPAGEAVLRRAALPGTVVAGFFSASCAPCKTTIARIAAGEHDLPSGERLWFVVADAGDPAAEAMVAGLSGSGPVAVVDGADPVLRAFGGVNGYPTLLEIRDGTIRAAAHDLDELRSLAGAGRVGP